MKIHIDAYYDLTCRACGRSRSTDFGKGMEISKSFLNKRAYAEGWKCRAGKTLCPNCNEDGGTKNGREKTYVQ